MSTFKDTYTLLPGKSRKMFALASPERQKLYLAEDHILVVSVKGYEEHSYKIALKMKRNKIKLFFMKI